MEPKFQKFAYMTNKMKNFRKTQNLQFMLNIKYYW